MGGECILFVKRAENQLYVTWAVSVISPQLKQNKNK